MPDRVYKVTYQIDDAQALPKLRAIKTAVEGIDSACMKGAARIKALDDALEKLNTDSALAAMHLEDAGRSADKLGGSIAGMLPAWQVFEMGTQLAMKFGEYINSAREHMRELAKEAQETRDRMRELANLQDHDGPDNEVVGETLKLGMAAGLVPDEARKFMEQFEGSMPAGRTKGNIDPGIEKDLALEGMKFGNRVGLQPGTSGDLTGVLAQYGKINSVEHGAGQLGSIAFGLNAGRGNLEPLMRSLIKTAGSIVEEHGGAVDDLPQLAAMLGVASTNATPDRAGTMLKNGVNSLRKFTGKQGETLKELGIKPEMKFSEALGKIAPKILEADARGEGGDTYLRGANFNNEDEIRALVQLSRNYKVFRERVDKAKESGNGKAVIESNERFLNTDRAGMNRKLEAKDAAQKFLIGQEGEFSRMGMAAGSTKLREEGWLGGTGNWLRHFGADLGGVLPLMGADTNQNNEAKGRFIKMLADESTRVGIDVSRNFKATKDLPDKDRVQKFQGLSQHAGEILFNDTEGLNLSIQDIIEQGGNPFGDDVEIKKRLDNMIGNDKDHRARINAVRRNANAAPAPGAARAGARPGPGGAAAAIPGAGAAPGPGADLGQKLDKLVAATEKTNTILDNKLAANLGEGAGPVGAARL